MLKLSRQPFSILLEKNLRKEIEKKSKDLEFSLRSTLPPQALEDISESIVEGAEILGTGIPKVVPYGKRNPEIGGVIGAAALKTSIFPFIKPKIVVTKEYLDDIRASYESEKPNAQQTMKKHLQATFAEEIAHLYVHNRYPRVDERTVVANWVGGELYKNDRGEKFSRKFAEGYSKCKETLKGRKKFCYENILHFFCQPIY